MSGTEIQFSGEARTVFEVFMMDQEQLLQLERAAMDLMSPPLLVSDEKRKQADSMFIDLRKSKLPYNTCKFILENSQSDFVQFQAASTIHDAVLREWAILPPEEKEALRNYVIQYLTAQPALATYVISGLLHTFSVMVKRATLEDDRKKLFDSVFSTVTQLLAVNDTRMQQLGCSLLSALLTEYSTSSSTIGLPLEFHMQCKKAIEGEELLKVLLFAVQILQRYVGLEWESLSTGDHILLSKFLSLTLQVLSWDFQHHSIYQVHVHSLNMVHSSHVILKPPKSYASTFLDPSFLYLFFQLFSKVDRANMIDGEAVMHNVVQCLSQLASLTKPVFDNDITQQTYVVNFVSGILECVSSSSTHSQQKIYGLSCILRRLVTTFPTHYFVSLGRERLNLLFQLLSQLSCLCARETVISEFEDDSLMYQESLEHFLEVWVSFIEGWSSATHPHSLPRNVLTLPLVEVFNAYIQSKLSAPRGWRDSGGEEASEIVEIEEDDRNTYMDELSSIGSIARTVAEHSLPLLLSVLEQCINECMHIYSLIRQDPNTLKSQYNNLDNLYEDLHWLTMIAGYTLCDIVKGEDVLVPTDLMQFSILRFQHTQQATNTGISISSGGTNGSDSLGGDGNIAMLSLQSMERGGVVGDSESVDLSKLDPVVSLVLSMCRLCVMEKLFISHGMIEILSPQLCDTTVWCLSRIVEPYLMLSEESYEQISIPLFSVFGRHSESGRWLTALMVETVAFNLSVWASEESLSLSSIQLLKSLVKSQQRATVAIHCDALWSLMRQFSAGQEPISNLPPDVQRELMGSLVMCASGERKQQFLTELLQPFRDRFTSLVQHTDYKSLSQDGVTQQTLMTVMEAMCGLAQSTKMGSVEEFFTFMLPILEAAVHLLEIYADTTEVVGVILDLFSLVTENYIVFLNQAHTLRLYEICLALIRMYTKSNIGKYSKLVLAEEEQCDDLLFFIKILSNLTIMDAIDFSSDSNTEHHVQPVDVVVTGISVLLPLMNEELLKFPNLCNQFYTLIQYLCECFPEKVALLPDDLFIACIKLLEAGLTNFSYGPDICKCSLECINSIAVHYGSTPHLHTHTPLTQSLQHYLKLLFELMLSSSFDMDLIGPAADATFALICSQQEYYTSLAEALVSGQSRDPQNHSRLVEAFHQLTPPSLPLDLSRNSRTLFHKNLEQFLPFVKGFLCYW